MNNTKIKSYFVFLLGAVILFSSMTSFSTSNSTEQMGNASSVRTITFIEKSTGLQPPTMEGGNTELELADMNNDGNPDLISVGDHGNPYINTDEHGIMVWLNNGQGIWSVCQVGDFGYGGIEAGDLDLDGNLDVVWGIHHDYSGIPGFGDTLIGAALGDGTGTNWIPWATGLGTGGEDWGMFETALADFDGNGRLDLVSQSFGYGQGYHVYENHGNGTWTQRWFITDNNNNNDLEIGDFNVDGIPDFVGNRDGTHVYFGDGTFNFTLMQNGLPAGLWNGLDCGDMNTDGSDDLVLGSGSAGVKCYTFNTENNEWDSASNGLPTTGVFSPQFGDVDGDGNLDIVGYVGPTGYVYLGDSNGNWILDGTFTMPSPGDISEFLVDGDFDHDGREDVTVVADSGSWPNDHNVMKAFSPWVAPSVLTALIQSPHGGETFRSGSIRNIRWLSAVPASQGDASVDILLSRNGVSGPWEPLASDVPNNGCYQWLIGGSGSQNCRIKVVVTTSQSSASAISGSDFTILGFDVDAHGPYYGSPGQVIQFTGTASNGNPPYEYHWDFGDGTSAIVQNPTHSYTSEGNYTVVLAVTDADDLTVSDTTWALIGGSNTPPEIPEIQGPSTGKPLLLYKYRFVTTDPELDPVSYFVDWGDNTSSGWLGPFSSGVQASAVHNWSKKGTYSIRVKAKDSHGAESEWGTLSVKIPFSYDIPFLTLFRWFFERFPQAFPLVRYVFELMQS
jgi:hypothetical protein